jgi:hypothetical protein
MKPRKYSIYIVYNFEIILFQIDFILTTVIYVPAAFETLRLTTAKPYLRALRTSSTFAAEPTTNMDL